MASTNFIDNVTPIVAEWLNEVNTAVFTTIPTIQSTITAINTALTFKVDKTSDTGSAVLPKGTTAERDVTPVKGFLRYNDTLDQFEGYGAGGWGKVGGGATGGGANSVFYLNDQTVTLDYSIPSGQNAMTAGPITIASGVTVTVPSGSVWTVV